MLARTRVAAKANVTAAVRTMSAAGGSITNQPSLDVPFPHVPTGVPEARSGEVQSTVLANGVRVVSADLGESVTSFGVFVGAGSRFETDATHGVSQVLQKMAFKSTTTRTAVRVIREAEDAGVRLSTDLSRDVLSYCAEGPRGPIGGRNAFFSIAETVAEPRLRDWEVLEAVGEARETQARRAGDLDDALTEATYAAAFYDDSALGRSSGIPAWQGGIAYEDFLAYRDSVVVGSNLVVAATGIEHEELVGLTDAFFGDVPSGERPSAAATAYVGGESRERAAGGHAFVRVAFGGAGHGSADFAAVQVLQAAATGSGDVIKFPGSGLQSRVGSQVAAKLDGVLRARGFLFSHEDASLFGAHLQVTAGEAGDAVRGAVDAIRSVASGELAAEELARAKAVAKHAVMNANTGSVGLGRSALLNGSVGVATQLAAIDAVSAADVARVAQAVAAQRPTIASAGSIAGVPRVDAL